MFRDSSSIEPVDVADAFAPAIWEEAQRLANRYRVVIDPTEDGGYVGGCEELHGVIISGATPEECFRETLFGIAVSLAIMLTDGIPIPPPRSSGRRDRQINIRVSTEEKARLEAASRREGFEGLGDFVRTAAVRAANRVLR